MESIDSQLDDLRCEVEALRLMAQAMAELMTPRQRLQLSASLDRMCDLRFAQSLAMPQLGIPAQRLHRALNRQAGYMCGATLELQPHAARRQHARSRARTRLGTLARK